MTHVQTVQEIYGAFERHDVAAILERLAPDVQWEYATVPLGVPWLEPRRGREQAAGFFAAMGAFDLEFFRPKVFLAQGNIVVVLIDVALQVKTTGRRVEEEDEIHIWHFDADGLVSRFTHKVDTHQHWLAVQPSEQ